MKKNQLTIISRRENITAQAIIKGNTATFAYEVADNQVNAVVFSVVRGTEASSQNFQNIAFRGSMYGEVFNVENNAYQKGDSLLYDEIFDICKEILNPMQDAENQVQSE